MTNKFKEVIIPFLFLFLIAIYYFYQWSIEYQFQDNKKIGKTTAIIINRKFARSGFSYEVKYNINNVSYIGRVNTDTLNLPTGSKIPINYLINNANKVCIAPPSVNVYPINFKHQKDVQFLDTITTYDPDNFLLEEWVEVKYDSIKPIFFDTSFFDNRVLCITGYSINKVVILEKYLYKQCYNLPNFFSL